MSVHDETLGLLKRLRLSGVQESLRARLDQAHADQLDYGEFLYRLLSDEVARREARQLELRLRRAKFDQEKVLEEFDFSFNPSIPKPKILELATCRFVVERRNLVLVGPTGVGKSHVAQALGHQACRAGYSVLYRPAEELLRELHASRADESYEAALKRLVKPDLLIVDDLGLRPLSGEGPYDLYEVIRGRYERGATIWTSNRDVEAGEWAGLFVDPLLASAALDRLLHHAEILRLEGETYRNPAPHRRLPPREPAETAEEKDRMEEDEQGGGS